MKRSELVRVALIALFVVGLGCNLLTKASEDISSGIQPTQLSIQTPEQGSQPTPTQLNEPVQYDTDFPLPEDVQNFNKIPTADRGISFITKMSNDEVISFYREAFTKDGWEEYELLTSITEGAFSLVFRRGSSIPIVLQGVDLGGGLTSLSLRNEDT